MIPFFFWVVGCFKVSYKVEPRRKDLEEEAVYELSNNEDAPMCIDAHPTVSKRYLSPLGRMDGCLLILFLWNIYTV